jgi:hypothetical protein
LQDRLRDLALLNKDLVLDNKRLLTETAEK